MWGFLASELRKEIAKTALEAVCGTLHHPLEREALLLWLPSVLGLTPTLAPTPTLTPTPTPTLSRSAARTSPRSSKTWQVRHPPRPHAHPPPAARLEPRLKRTAQ